MLWAAELEGAGPYPAVLPPKTSWILSTNSAKGEDTSPIPLPELLPKKLPQPSTVAGIRMKTLCWGSCRSAEHLGNVFHSQNGIVPAPAGLWCSEDPKRSKQKRLPTFSSAAEGKLALPNREDPSSS